MKRRRKVSRRRWTKQEDDRVEEFLNEEHLNLQECFRILAKELKRSTQAVELRWYMVLSNPNHPKYRGTKCFVSICRKRALVNRKILADNKNIKPVRVKVSWWKSVLNWLRT